MSAFSPPEVAARLGSGLLSFPVTHFTEEFQLDETEYRRHIAWLGQHDAAGLFAAGGTGEFFSLRFDEVELAVAAAVKESSAEMPVIAPAGYGTAIAVELAQSAQRAGADAVLGSRALERCLRPVAYRSVPAPLLPIELRSDVPEPVDSAPNR